MHSSVRWGAYGLRRLRQSEQFNARHIPDEIMGPAIKIEFIIFVKVAMVFIFNLDKVSLKKLFPTMNI